MALASLGLTRSKLLVLASVLLVMFLAAVDVTVVETAMPTIIGVLGGAQHYAWVFTIYLLTNTVVTPVFGKLADLFGRKRVLLLGIGVFVLGSVLCGFSQNMLQLIISRGIQGIGAGCVLPVTLTVIGDLFTPAQRARMQGVFSMVWGGAALVGPILGGVIVDLWSWHWIFFINVPVGMLAAAMLWRHLQEQPSAGKPAVDYAGAALLTAGTTALMLALSLVGAGMAWLAGSVAGLLAAAVACLVAFVFVERRAAEPVLPLSLFRNPLVLFPNVAGFLAGAVLIGFNVYLPLFRQGVQGGTAIDAGLVLMPLTLGWPLASLVAGRVILKVGYRASAFVGTLLQAAAGALMLSTGLSLDASPWLLRVSMFLIGAGMGFSNLAILLAVQSAVSHSVRGAATASVSFIRTLGQTVGLAAFGTLVNLQLLARLRAVPGLVPPQAAAVDALNLINSLVDPDKRSLLAPERLETMETALAHSLMPLFWLLVGLAVINAIVTLLIPGVRPDSADQPATSQPEGSAKGGGTAHATPPAAQP